MIGMAGVPSRMQEGMLVLSGDVLLLFNPLQIDGQLDGAAAISMKEHVSIGKNHGVFLNNGRDPCSWMKERAIPVLTRYFWHVKI